MSFATNIKNEISKLETSKLENIAELSGFMRNNGSYTTDEINLVTENATVAKRVYLLVKDIYDVICETSTKKNNHFAKNNLYLINIKDKAEIILKDLSIIDDNNNKLESPEEYILGSEEEIRAYLRGSFLSKGSVNDPKTSRYHLEYMIENKSEANFINHLLNGFLLNSKVLKRDKGYMVYIKEAEKIGDFLRVISAFNAVMYYEDIRIYRDHKNMTNRLNNCEQANIDKIIETANNQINDINLILEVMGMDLLDEKLQEVINYRLKYPDASLQELSEIITYETNKEITKSGLNHRFRKIKELATRLRDDKGKEIEII